MLEEEEDDQSLERERRDISEAEILRLRNLLQDVEDRLGNIKRAAAVSDSKSQQEIKALMMKNEELEAIKQRSDAIAVALVDERKVASAEIDRLAGNVHELENRLGEMRRSAAASDARSRAEISHLYSKISEHELSKAALQKSLSQITQAFEEAKKSHENERAILLNRIKEFELERLRLQQKVENADALKSKADVSKTLELKLEKLQEVNTLLERTLISAAIAVPIWYFIQKSRNNNSSKL